MPFFFPTQRVSLDAYWLVNATVSYKLQPGVEVFGRVENAARSALSRGVRLRIAAACGLCGPQADVRRHGGHRHRLGEVANGNAAARRRRWPASRWRLRRWRGPRGALAAEPPHAAGAGKPRRIVSLDLCTDQLLVELVERERIAAVTHLAADPAVSAIPEKARGIPITHGGGRGRAALRSRSGAGRARSASRPRVDLLRRLGRNVVVVPLPQDLDGVRAAVRAVAAAVGEEREGRGDDRRLRSAPGARWPRPARSRRPPPSSIRSAARSRAPAAWPMRRSPPPAFATWRPTIA